MAFVLEHADWIDFKLTVLKGVPGIVRSVIPFPGISVPGLQILVLVSETLW